MKWLSAGLIFVNATTLVALLLGLVGRGLGVFAAVLAVFAGLVFAFGAYLATNDSAPDDNSTTRPGRYRSIWFWLLFSVFAIFAVRSFCWLIYIDGSEFKIQSPNNLGDLALHITYIRDFASGVALWPDNPIFVGSKMRYPAGVDLFNAVLALLNVDLIRGLVWVGLAGSLATFYALWRWGREFAIAGFLFNGGVFGFQFFRTWQIDDFQGGNAVAWKSIPLSMFVTQRGWLYAIPAALLLLWHWREKFLRTNGATGSVPSEEFGTTQRSSLQDNSTGLPFAVELTIYASLPLFNVHTFLALSVVLAFLFLCGDASIRKDIGLLIGGALVPATFFVWLVSDNFHASSMVQFKPGWVLRDPTLARSNVFDFWFGNFGLWFPLILCLLGVCVWRLWKMDLKWNDKMPPEIAFLLPAVAIFLAGMLYKFAPWEWDNLKIMIWGYFLALPFLWTHLIQKWSLPVRTAVCFALFCSGFLSLFGGLAAGKFGFANRAEVAAVGVMLRHVPLDARLATFPTYNHPVLLQGRKVVMGYPGHLWTQGFNYSKAEVLLKKLMNGESDWRQAGRTLGIRYVFWGREEKENYPESKRPWETSARLVVPSEQGPASEWGMIYDLESLEPNAPRTLGAKTTPTATPSDNDE